MYTGDCKHTEVRQRSTLLTLPLSQTPATSARVLHFVGASEIHFTPRHSVTVVREGVAQVSPAAVLRRLGAMFV